MKSLKIFKKDALIASRDMLIIYIMVIPVLIAAGIRFLAPGMSDTTLKIALWEGEDPEVIEYMDSMARIQLLPDRAALEQRVLKRDDVPGIISNGSHFDIITEGNEDSRVVDGASQLASLYQLGSTVEKTTAEIYSYGKQVPQTRTMLANILIQIIIMLGGMIIALGMVDEKCDNTISAIRTSPVRLTHFIAGKCMLGCCTTLVSIVICLAILEYDHVNWGMLALVCICTTVLAAFTGLAQGVISSDIIEAAAGVKMLMVPMIAGILIYELCSEKWQWTMYWNPFYWSYKGSIQVLSGIANWSEILLYSFLVLALSGIACRFLKPVIDHGLRKA